MNFLFILFFFCLFPLDATPQFTVHYMWGLWDNFPLPRHYRNTQIQNDKILNTQSIIHQKEEILSLINRFSNEFDVGFYDLFHRIPRKVSQADLGRYILIYYSGGMYLDLDVIAKGFELTETQSNYRNGVWFTESVVDLKLLSPREKPYQQRIAQYAFFVNGKESPLLLEIIHESIRRVKILYAEEKTWSDTDVLWATGPDVVTTILHETSLSDFEIVDLQQSKRMLVHKNHGGWRSRKDQSKP